jgi:hypothetical protein
VNTIAARSTCERAVLKVWWKLRRKLRVKRDGDVMEVAMKSHFGGRTSCSSHRLNVTEVRTIAIWDLDQRMCGVRTKLTISLTGFNSGYWLADEIKLEEQRNDILHLQDTSTACPPPVRISTTSMAFFLRFYIGDGWLFELLIAEIGFNARRDQVTMPAFGRAYKSVPTLSAKELVRRREK